jgi:hypothetical protein
MSRGRWVALGLVGLVIAGVWHWRRTSRQWQQGRRYAAENPYLRAIDLSLRGAT